MKISKRFCLLLAILLIFFAFIIRILYVNKVEYKIPTKQICNVGDVVNCNGLEISVTKAEYMEERDIETNFGKDVTQQLQESCIIIYLSLSNSTLKSMKFNVPATGIMYGDKFGGNSDPYFYQMVNTNSTEIEEVQPGQRKDYILAFSTHETEIPEQTMFICSLYPQNISFLLTNVKQPLSNPTR